MKNQEALQKIGLSEKESEVYLTLAETGPATISLLSKETGLHRPALYKVIPLLEKRGLVSVFPKGKLKYYVAEAPEKLRTILEQARTDLDTLIPEIKSIFQSVEKNPLVKFLDGKQAIQRVFLDLMVSLKQGEVYYRYSAVTRDIYDNEPDYRPPQYVETMKKKEIECFLVLGAGADIVPPAFPWLEVKVLPKARDLFSDNVTQLIYADKVAFIDYNTETALIIENPIIATFQRKLFKLLYSKL